jgi:hypothetical protein
MISDFILILVRVPEGKRPLGRRGRRWENNIRMDIRGNKSRDSSVGIALGYGLDNQGSRIRFPAGAGNFSPPHPERIWGPPSLLSNR